MEPKTETIRAQNDQFRIAMPEASSVPGRIMITRGIQLLVSDDVEPNKDLAQLFEAIRSFDAFDRGNDPHQEHDFGALEFNGQKVFWKFDYYAKDLMHGSADPSDLAITMRVLTIMLASEY